MNKIVGLITSPLLLVFIVLASGKLLQFLGMRNGESAWGGRMARLGSIMLGLALAFLWVVSCSITTTLIGVPLERPWQRQGEQHGIVCDFPDADAIIILGGGVGVHDKCKVPELFTSADRVWQGAKLYHLKKGLLPDVKVFCTGGGCELATLPLLMDFGVPKEAIWFSEKPRNTEEEARLIKAHIRHEKPKVLLVTSAWHMTRAKYLFEHFGFNVIPAPTDFEMSFGLEKGIGFGAFLPNADAMVRNTYAIKEWVAIIGYRLFRF